VKWSAGARRFGLTLRALDEALAARKTPMAIIGGIAMNANGVARFTADIDATIPGADLDLAALAKTLKAHGLVPRVPDAVRFARENQVLLLEHRATGLEVDLSLAWISFELEAIERAKSVLFGDTRIRAVRPEDLAIYKLIANRPRDLTDVESLLLLHGKRMDLQRVRRVLGHLAEHLDGKDRRAVLDELLDHMPSGTPTRRAIREVDDTAATSARKKISKKSGDKISKKSGTKISKKFGTKKR
jgi:Nucleotidyl transferase AbiEii toxin, Type IV TA system